MPIRASGEGELNEIDRWDGGAGWVAFPDEEMRRASHALRIEGELWVVDPVDVPGLDAWLADRGDVAGVAVLLARHRRDAAAVANRHGVSVHIPDWMTGVADEFPAPVERLGETLGDYEVRRLVDTVGWQEAALYDPEGRTLLVPESLGTADYYRADGERLGVHPMRRVISPPRALVGLDVDRLLLGHGEGVFDDPGGAVSEAVSKARKRAPEVYFREAKRLLVR